jgi:beta-glucosidase
LGVSNIDPQAGLRAKQEQAAGIVAQMSLQEKAAFCSGRNFWHLQACERLGVVSIMVTDGPHGLRKQAGSADHVGLNASVPATCFPTASALASSWDTALIHEVGVALGEQCVAEGVSVLLGPGMNIKRHPLCGRNFEYFSEDPLLSGELAAAMIQGVQSQGVGTSIKHYAVNNQEQWRMFIDAIVDERTLREIYLRGFEIAVRKAQPWTVMCAYNRLNGTYCSEHEWLLNKVLRDEWGFEGLVVTDWGATNDRVKGVTAGLDLEMPASGGINDARIVAAVQAGELPEAELDRIVCRIVSLSLLGATLMRRNETIDQQTHHQLAHKAAAESAVLLKNEQLLPLQSASSIAVIGAFACEPRYQGAGSSQVTPTQLDCALDAIREVAGDETQVTYAPGYDPQHSEPDNDAIEQAVALARSAEVAVVFAGLPGIYESEGFDREHMGLPQQHNRLIESVCAANPNTVVVLFNGAPVEMPWIAKPQAVLECYLAGQAGGTAVADLLFGRLNPSGKLAETFPLRQSDVLADKWFPGAGRQVQYREGLYVGYRYFDSADVPVLFPFGHGLSYTRFDYANLTLSVSTYEQGGELSLSLDVTNIGEVAGAEIVQVYVSAIESNVHRPQQELRAFVKLALGPGETRRAELTLDDEAFAVFDTDAQAWVVEAGNYELRIGSSSRDIRLSQQLTVNSRAQIERSADTNMRAGVFNGDSTITDQHFAAMLGRPVPPAESVRPYHINSSLDEIANTWPGGMVRSKVITQFKAQMGVTKADKTTTKMFEVMADNMPLRAMVLFSGGRLDFRKLDILVALLNRQFLRALRLLARPGKTITREGD